MLFYLGVKKLEARYISDFEKIDKEALEVWREFVTKKTGDANIVDTMVKARFDIPVKDDKFGEKLVKAEKVSDKKEIYYHILV